MALSRTNEELSSNSVVIHADISRVVEVLSDPRTYPRWLVGAKQVPQVDEHWPALGSKFRHRIGFGPFTVPGSTSIREWNPPSAIVLAAGMGVLGEAVVRFELEPVDEGTRVTIKETFVKGPARVALNTCGPVVGAVLWGRNAFSLSALEALVLARSSTA